MVYYPGLENKATNALSRVPPFVHLNHISTPTLLDVSVIKKEIEEDEWMKEITVILEKNEEGVPRFSMD